MIEVRPWSPQVPASAITALLHSAYAPLAARGLRFLAAHQDDSMTLQRLSRGWAFLAYAGAEMVGTISLFRPEATADCTWYRQPGVLSFGQFGVLPAYQRQGIGRTLLDHAETRAALEGARELALDTAEEAAHLIRWYRALGYRQVDRVSWSDTNYRSVVLSKTLNGPA